MAKIYFCLLDCSAIQRYVFGSNKLKTNFGASYIVEKLLYEEWIPEALHEVFSGEKLEDIKKRFTEWRETSQNIVLEKDCEALKWEIGYVGGGNALLLFCAENKAREFIKIWTQQLLVNAPGARPVATIVAGDNKNIAAGIDDVYQELAKNKNKYIAETIIPRHGITAECKITGLSAEIFDRTSEEKRWLSAVAYTKIKQVKKATDFLNDEYGAALENKYVFGSDIEKLGQLVGEENHVAIVHIDGNGIGGRFVDCLTLSEKRQLSTRISDATKSAARQTLTDLVAKMTLLKDKHLTLARDPDSKKEILPFRFVIGAGDDVTFVCDARLGLFLAERFMLAFAKQTIELDFGSNGSMNEKEKARREKIQKPLSSCAGVAIIKTKYPFYRGYKLAEQLCDSAKGWGRPDNTSWLDFHVSYRGLSGSLGDIRQQKYMVGKASLLWRPWKVRTKLDPSAANVHNFAMLKNAIREFSKPGGWSRSKIGELAQTLIQGQEQTETFIQFNQARALELPRMAADQTIHESGWRIVVEEKKHDKENKGVLKTPYFDILEAMKFYPDCLLQEEK